MANADDRLRSTAYWVLWRAQDDGRFQHLRRGLDPRSNWLPGALELAVACDEAAVIPAITQLLDEADPRVRALAAGALGALGCRGHSVNRELLRECHDHEVDHEVAVAAGVALARMGDQPLLELCQREIRRCIDGQVLPAQALRLLPKRLEVLGIHPAPAARELVQQVVDWRRRQLGTGLTTAFTVPVDSRDDEQIGDLADALVASGDITRAEAMYRRAAELDPGDSEWTRKLSDLQNGRVPDVSSTVGADPVLWAGAQALAQRRLPAPEPWAHDDGAPGLAVAVLASWRPRQDGAASDPPLPDDLASRLREALELAARWPQYGLHRLGWADRGAGAGAATHELEDRFGGRLPAALADAGDVVDHLPQLHALATGAALGRSEALPAARALDELRQAVGQR